MDQFRIIVQIEQVNSEGKVLCTYGPSPIAIFVTENEDHAIDEYQRIQCALETYGCKIVPLEELLTCPSCKAEVTGLTVNGVCLDCEHATNEGYLPFDATNHYHPTELDDIGPTDTKSVKETRATYKVWVHVEEIDEANDSYADDFEGSRLPVSLGTFDTPDAAYELVDQLDDQFVWANVS